MPESEVTVEFSKKRKRNEKEEGQDQVLSFRELNLILIKKLRILMKNVIWKLSI